MSDWKEAIHRQRAQLARLLHEPLARLAERAAAAWGDGRQLNEALFSGFAELPHCTYLYVLDADRRQASDSVGRYGVVPGHRGTDRSDRPYMREAIPPWGFLLSDAYVSRHAGRPTLTAVHVIGEHGAALGYVAADFDLRDLPVTARLYEEPGRWQQIHGDPAIRSTVFLQRRVESFMDQNIDQALSILNELLTERGMFQSAVHFSNSVATAWFLEDPLRYRVLDHEALADPDVCLAYPCAPYPDNAAIPKNDIAQVLASMGQLRLMDETIYLRSSSINIMNGMISVTFSCDGTHYMPCDEFLSKNMSFWLGRAA